MISKLTALILAEEATFSQGSQKFPSLHFCFNELAPQGFAEIALGGRAFIVHKLVLSSYKFQKNGDLH